MFNAPKHFFFNCRLVSVVTVYRTVISANYDCSEKLTAEI